MGMNSNSKPSWFERFLMWLLPYWEIIKVVNGQKVVYLRRFYIFNPKNVHRFGKIYLHHILRSDDDRDPHQHPWPFITIILKGGYNDEQWNPGYEIQREEARQWAPKWVPRKIKAWEPMFPGNIARRQASHLHRVQLFDESQSAWTLVICGKHCQEWGFDTVSGWVHWKKYLEVTNDPNRN